LWWQWEAKKEGEDNPIKIGNFSFSSLDERANEICLLFQDTREGDSPIRHQMFAAAAAK